MQGLGAWNYFLSFPEQFPQVLRARNSIYMKFEHKNNIQAYKSVYHLCQKFFSQNFDNDDQWQKNHNLGFAKFNKLLNFADRQKMLNHENKQNFYSKNLLQSFVDLCTNKKIAFQLALKGSFHKKF